MACVLLLAALEFSCARGELSQSDLADCTTSTLSVGEEDHAEDRARARRGFLESLEDVRRLAAARFPLPRAELDVQVEWLTRVVEAKLRFPEEVRWPNGSHDRYQVRQLFRLILVWQHPAFIQPLLALLRRNPEYRYYAAAALVRYGDAELRHAVEEFRGFEHYEPLSADTGRTVTIDGLLDVPPGPSAVEFKEDSALLPHAEGTWSGLAAPPEGMRIPAALSALASPSRSIRLQAWVYLADWGIIAPAATVQQAWMELSEAARAQIVDYRATTYLGEDRMQGLCEWLLTRPREECSQQVEGQMLFTLGELGSGAGLLRMKEIIVERLPRIRPEADEQSLYEQDPLLSRALLAMTSCGRASDLTCWLRLTRSSHREVRQHAWAGLAGIEHPDALPALERAFLEEEPHVMGGAIWKLESAGRRLTPLRWQYLDLLAKELQRRNPDWDVYPDLLNAFSELAGKSFGPNGRLFPIGLDERAARGTAARCLEWYRHNRPREGTAKP